MSEEEGSTPNFLASLIFTCSLISSSTVSWRVGCLWVEMKSSLERCSMSRSVMGSPLTITATVCACACGANMTAQAQNATQPASNERSGYGTMAVMIMLDLDLSQSR